MLSSILLVAAQQLRISAVQDTLCADFWLAQLTTCVMTPSCCLLPTTGVDIHAAYTGSLDIKYNVLNTLYSTLSGEENVLFRRRRASMCVLWGRSERLNLEGACCRAALRYGAAVPARSSVLFCFVVHLTLLSISHVI